MGRSGGGGGFSGGGGGFSGGGGFGSGGFSGGGGGFGGGPSGHSGGGGSFGGGGRSGRSGGGGFGGGGFSGGSGGGGGYRGGGFYGGGFGPFFGGPRIGGFGCGTAIVVGIIILVLIFMGSMAAGGGSGDRDITDSTYAREKIQGSGYKNEVYDELGWFSNTNTVANQIRHFYDKTGVQPAIYLENRPDLIGDKEGQEKEAKRIFDELGLNDGSFLFVYFDNDGTDGDWNSWMGNAAGTVMDAEAMQIFGDYLSKNWYSDKSEDELFADTFNETADRIMSKTTNANDVAIYVWIAIAVIGAGILIFVIFKQKRKHEAEKAAETERILKTKINDLEDDPLLNKYKDKK